VVFTVVLVVGFLITMEHTYKVKPEDTNPYLKELLEKEKREKETLEKAANNSIR